MENGSKCRWLNQESKTTVSYVAEPNPIQQNRKDVRNAMTESANEIIKAPFEDFVAVTSILFSVGIEN